LAKPSLFINFCAAPDTLAQTLRVTDLFLVFSKLLLAFIKEPSFLPLTVSVLSFTFNALASLTAFFAPELFPFILAVFSGIFSSFTFVFVQKRLPHLQ
jgi:hypothetical protein